MKLFLVLSVVFLVSADARPRGGSWLGKITYHFKGLLSATKEMACESEWLPLKNFLSCDSSSPYSFCNGYDCPEFDEKKLNVSGKIVEDYTLRCYYKPYKWVSTSYNGNYDYKELLIVIIEFGCTTFSWKIEIKEGSDIYTLSKLSLANVFEKRKVSYLVAGWSCR